MASRKRRFSATLVGGEASIDEYVCSVCERNDKDRNRDDKDINRDDNDGKRDDKERNSVSKRGGKSGNRGAKVRNRDNKDRNSDDNDGKRDDKDINSDDKGRNSDDKDINSDGKSGKRYAKDGNRDAKSGKRDVKSGNRSAKDGKVVGWCPDCEVYLCSECFDSHRTEKSWRNHVLVGEDSMPRRPYCDRCEFVCKTVDAEGYCKPCEKYLCIDCKDEHRKIRIFRQHIMLDKADMPKAAQQRYDTSRKRRAEYSRDIKVRGGDGFTSWISGCVVLPGGRLVVLDRHNCTVKLVDLTRNKVLGNFGLRVNVGDIARVTDSRVAVTCRGDQTIRFIDVTAETNCIDSMFKVVGQCRGIACLTDPHRLVVSFDEPVKIEIISLTGDVLQNVVVGDIAKRLFTKPWYVEVSNDQKTIYVADNGKDTVTSLSFTGEVRATYQDDRLSHPYGLAVDEADNVYVCGYGSHNVVQMTSELTHARQLIQHADGWTALGLTRAPECVGYCRDTDSLYIGMLYSDEVKELRLKY